MTRSSWPFAPSRIAPISVKTGSAVENSGKDVSCLWSGGSCGDRCERVTQSGRRSADDGSAGGCFWFERSLNIAFRIRFEEPSMVLHDFRRLYRQNTIFPRPAPEHHRRGATFARHDVSEATYLAPRPSNPLSQPSLSSRFIKGGVQWK